MSLVPRIDPLPAGLANLRDHEACARERLDPAAWAYISGAAGEGLTCAGNRAAWDRMQLLPRVLRPLAEGHTRVELLGRTLAHPILLAPVAYQRLAHPDGEIASAHAAAAQQAGMVVSTQASVRMEDVARAVRAEPDRGPLWFQLYFQPDRGITEDLVVRAQAAGYEALVVTVDAPVHGGRSGFRLPPGITAASLEGYSTPPQEPAQDAFARMAHAPTWDDIEWLLGIARMPVVLKGILHPEDARRAVRMGVSAVVVSNHAGRTLDGAVASAAVLPQVVAAVGGDVAVLVDGGIRTGTDILKASALGARAVLVGQPLMWGLACAGAVGVAHVLRLLRDELAIAMALCGCASLAEAGPGLLLGQA